MISDNYNSPIATNSHPPATRDAKRTYSKSHKSLILSTRPTEQLPRYHWLEVRAPIQLSYERLIVYVVTSTEHTIAQSATTKSSKFIKKQLHSYHCSTSLALFQTGPFSVSMTNY